jgi:hypothetical protein
LSEMLSLPSTAADLTLSTQRKREKLFEAWHISISSKPRHGAGRC